MRLKKMLIYLYERVMVLLDYAYLKITKNHPAILSFDETICSIKSTNKSLCRFGDGEFAIMKVHSIKFQKYDNVLAKRLKIILGAKEENLLISLPDVFINNKEYTKKTSDYWMKEVAKYRLMVYSLVNRDQIYGNAFVSRPYMNWTDKENAGDRFKSLFELWEGKHLLIVEGDKTRMGVGNDIFNKAKSIKRVLIPAENAFSRYDEIFGLTLKNYKDELILISAGPTAKLLVYDLFKKGIQALDIGHIDLEYEWYLKSAFEKVIVDGKYTSEVNNGELVDEETSYEYLAQIVGKVN